MYPLQKFFLKILWFTCCVANMIDFYMSISGNQGASARRIRWIAEVEVYPLQIFKIFLKILCFTCLGTSLSISIHIFWAIKVPPEDSSNKLHLILIKVPPEDRVTSYT